MSSSRPANSPAKLWAILAIAVAAVLAYANSFGVPFVFDDELSIPGNPTLEHLTTAWSPPSGNGLTVSGRPLLNFSFAVNRLISGADAWSFHAVNLLIHVVAGVLVFGIVRQTLHRNPRVKPLLQTPHAGADLVAVSAAVLWVLHPLQTESVTYTVQRAESLCGLFLLLTLFCFIRAVSEPSSTRSRLWLVAAVVSCWFGALTKETIAAAPLLVALYDRTFVAKTWRDLWRRRWRFHATLASTWIILALLVASTGGRGGTFDFSAHGWWRYALTQFDALVRYLGLIIWPAPLAIDYGTFWITHVASIVPGIAIAIALLAATVVALRRWPALGFVAAWFWLTLAPSTLPPGTIQMIVEHRMYLPLIAPVVLAVTALDRLLGRRAVFVVAMLTIVFGFITARRNEDYATPVRLFEDTVAKRSQNARAMALLADYERRIGRRDDARRWLERSLQVDPSAAPVWNNLGNVWQELGEPAKAVACFQSALERIPGDGSTENNLANALVLAGRTDQAITVLQSILRREPQVPRARNSLAIALARVGRMDEAAAQFQVLVQEQPADSDARSNYADVLIALGRADDAISQLRAASRLQPQDAELHERIGVVLGRSGHLRDALTEFDEALHLNPNSATAAQNAAIARRRLGTP